MARPFGTKTLLALALGLLFVILSVVVVVLVNGTMKRLALSDAENSARMLLDHNLAIHTYFSQDLKPKLFEQLGPTASKDYFEPVWMSSTYAVRKMDKYFRHFNPSSYYYKECAVNARSPENEADNYEKAFLEDLQENPQLTTKSAIRVLDGKPYFTLLRRGEAMEESCLRCHSSPDKAPGDLVRHYGPDRSFHRSVDDVAQAISIRIPLSEAFSTAIGFSYYLSGLLLVALGGTFLFVWVGNKRMVIDPIARIREHAIQIATDNARLGEIIPEPTLSELRDLVAAFNQMSVALRKSYDELEQRVSERTKELAAANSELEKEIEERLKAEEALRESEQRLSLALAGANFGIWEWDLTSGKALWDERALSVLGYESNEFEPDLKNWKKLVHPEDWPRVSENLNLHLDGQLPTFEVEYRILNKSGDWQWALARGNVIAVDEEGKPTRMAGVFADITERRKTEEALKNSEAKYRFLTEHGRDLIWTLDLNLKTTFVTPSVEKVLGFTPEERMLQKVEDQLTPESLAVARQRLLEELSTEREQRIQEGKSVLVDLDYYHENGSIVCLQTAVTFIRDEKGTPMGLHGISRDITELKRTQEALRESAELLAEAQRVARIGNWSYDLRKNSVTWSDELYRIFGIEISDFDGRYDSFLNRVHPEDQQLVLQNNACARNEGTPFDFEYRIILRGGQVRVIREVGHANKDDAGNIIRLFGTAQDITDRKEAEQERERLRNQLFQAQKMEAIGTLTGGIAHDFNNLLTIINGYTELILSEKTSDDPAYSDLQKVLETGRKGAELVQSLLALSKTGESKPQPLDLNRTVENSVALMKRTLPKMIEIETVLGKGLSMVNADAAQVDQVLMKLCIKAKEAMPGGGKLRIETKKVIVDEADCKLQALAKPGSYVLIAVTDTGAGMDAETLDRLFDPFFTTKGWDFKKGTGLSLPVAKGIVEQHGGWITCESQPGKGTTFSLYFPIIEEREQVEDLGSPILTSAGGESILLVDDEEYVRDLGKRILEQAGYEIITASNGREALDIYSREQSNIGLVILDLIMPQMSGEQCLGELLKINPNVKVVVSSGHSLTQEERDRLGIHAKVFVNKPYEMKQLVQAVGGLL